MPKKSRIIVNNWSSQPDESILSCVAETIRQGRNRMDHYPFMRFPKRGLYVAAFRNKTSDSFDVRDLAPAEDRQ